LLQETGGGNGFSSIDEIFRQISQTIPQFAGLTFNKIGDQGVHILQMEEVPPMHPKDEEAIELAIAIQARRRSVRQQLTEVRKAAAVGTH
jgi:hypothetical protein